MTGGSDTREKLRAAILTFVMVTSVFGATVAFSGTAAANGTITTGPFSVQAGGVDQAGGGDSLVFTGGGNGFSSSSGTATFRLPAGSDVTFDQQNSSLAISTNDVTASNLRFQSDRALAVDLSGGGDASEDFTVSGIRYKAAPTADTTDTITATFGSDTGTTTVSTVGLSTSLDTVDLVRGSEQQGPTQLAIEAEGTAETDSVGSNDPLASGNTQPFVDGGDNITVTIDSQLQDRLSFDTSSSVSLNDADSDEDGDGTADNADRVGAVSFTDENTLAIATTGDIPNDAELEFEGIQFNTTGVGDDVTAAEFSSALNVTTTPKFATDPVTVQTNTNINANAPLVHFGDDGGSGDANSAADEGTNGLSPGSNGQALPQDGGSNAVQLEIFDDDTGGNTIGGEIQPGTVTVAIPDNTGVTFDQRQTVEVESSNDAESGAGNLRIGGNQRVTDSDAAVSVSEKSITIDVTQQSSDGDKLLIGKAVGGQNRNVDPLEFNVTAGSTAQNVNLTVTTSGGAANVVQNTSTGAETSSYDVDVRAAELFSNNGQDRDSVDGQGTDLTLGTDGDGETGIDSSNARDIVLQSQVDDDLLATGTADNVTITIPDSAPVTFDQTQDNTGNLDIRVGEDRNGGNLPGSDGNSFSSTDDGTLNNDEVTIVDDRTINLTFSANDYDLDQGGDIFVEGVQYNVTADGSGSTKLQATANATSTVTLTSANFINVSRAQADTAQSDADGGTTFGVTTEPATTTSVTVGTSQVSNIKITNSTGVGDNSLANLGGEDVTLAVTDSPAGGSASDISLNTTSLTTAPDGTAQYNTTVADTAATGTYNVTASVNANTNINVTTQYTVTAGSAAQFNVTGDENALKDTSGIGGSPGETQVAAYRVQIEDAGGNIVGNSDADVDVSVSGDGSLEDVAYGIKSDGTASTATSLDDDDSDGRFNYVASEDDGDTGEGQSGVFYVFVSNATPGDTDVTVSQGGVSDTGTATFFDSANQTAITLNESSVAAGDNVAVEAVAQTSDGTTIEVPRLTVGSITSNNITVATLSNVDSNTNDTGVATATATAQANGTTQINATIAGNQASTTLTTGSGSPLEGTAGQFDDDGDGDITAAELGGAVDQFGAGDLTAAELGEVVDAFAQS